VPEKRMNLPVTLGPLKREETCVLNTHCEVFQIQLMLIGTFCGASDSLCEVFYVIFFIFTFFIFT
jgi:hypothetical protein